MSTLTERVLEKFGKRLIGKTNMEDALKKLDKLTQEEVGMAVAQNLRATQVVDERVRGVATTVVAIDDRVAGVDDHVSGVDDRVKGVDEKVAELIHGADITITQAWETFDLNLSDGMEEKKFLKQIADDVDQEKRSSSLDLVSTDYRTSRIISENQLREKIHRWLSPPDPSTNHNIACDTQHKKIANWFFQGSIFREWKSTGSLLWIHGKREHCPTSHPDTL